MRTIRIKPATLANKDASEYRVDFYSSQVGQTFTLSGIEALDVEDAVAAEWTAADARVEIINYS